MKKLLLFFVALTTALIPTYGQQVSLFNHKIDSFLLKMEEERGLNGVVLVAIKGKPVYQKAFGDADPATSRTLSVQSPFYLGSVSKQFTTMGIMLLREQGKLNYNDPLSKFFPQFPEYASTITLKHLMTHTSGIKDQYRLGIYRKGLTNQDVFDLLLTQELDFEPGERYQYSNGAYVLLAMIIEKVSGKPLATFMEQYIFKPLGMKNSYVVHPKTKHAKNRAIGFSPKGTPGEKEMGNDYEIFTTGAGGIYANAPDLLKWDQALYTEKLISQKSVKEAYQPTILNDGTVSDYGFGWAIVRSDKIVGHTGSLNGFRNFIERDIAHNLTMIVLTNNTADYRNELREGLRSILNKYLPVAIINGNILDVQEGKLQKNQNIIIENGKIKAIEKDGNFRTSDYARIIDARGKYIIPGLVDAHIHFFQSGGLYTRPDAIDLNKYRPYSEEVQWLKEEAGEILNRYLTAGITTVVDVGGPMYNFVIREKFRPEPFAPSVYLTGPLVSTYQPEAFQIEDPPIVKVNNQEEAKALVRSQLVYEPDFIKIWYIASNPGEAVDNYPLIEAAVAEAKMNGLRVAVHATQLYTAKLAVNAGADLLVHSVNDVLIDDEFISLLQKQGTVYCPTLIVSANYGKVFSQQYQPSPEDYEFAPPLPLGSLMDLRHLPEPELVKGYLGMKDYFNERSQRRDSIMARNLQILLKANVPIATGTDAGNIGTMHASSYFRELDFMQNAGMDIPDILKASTLNGAKAMGKEQEFGSIEPGKRADLLILNENPLEHLDHLKSIEMIINKGYIIEPDRVLEKSPEDLAQEQLNAYNGHNLEAFLAPYAEDVKVYTFPNTLQYEGKATMRKTYQFIEQTPDLHCELVSRIVQGNTVIDQERVVFDKNRPPLEAIAIYKVRNGKIAEVYFVRK